MDFLFFLGPDKSNKYTVLNQTRNTDKHMQDRSFTNSWSFHTVKATKLEMLVNNTSWHLNKSLPVWIKWIATQLEKLNVIDFISKENKFYTLLKSPIQ